MKNNLTQIDENIFFFFFLSNTKEMQKTSNHGGKKKKMRANPTLSSSFPVDYDELGRG